MLHFPASFDYAEDGTMKMVYTGKVEDPEPYFSSTSIEEFLGATNPSASATNRMEGILKRIENFNSQFKGEVPSGAVNLIGSSKPARVHASDGTYTILAVKSSSRLTARDTYYYNKALLFYVINTARTDKANVLQHFINGEILPSIAKYGEYIGMRKGGIDLRRCLTDSVKRQIDAQKLDEKAYGTVTDAVYRIRYGLNTYSMRNVMNIDPSDNVREHLPKEELRILGELEGKVAGLVDIGMPLEDIATNPALIKIYRKPLA